MPANGPGSSKPSWRGGANQTPKAGRPATQGGREWTKKQDRSFEQAVLRYRMKVAGWALAFLVLTIVFVVWILSRPEPTPLLVAAAIDYDAPAPPNAWAKEDIERILSLRDAKIVSYPGKNVDWSTSVWKNAASGKIALKAQLDEAVGQGAKLVIVYLSMHGVVNGENEPCLLPPAASPLDSSKWLKVRDLLDSLFPKQGERPKRTLLILDCNRIDVNWDMGVLCNSFAERLKTVVKEKQAEYPGLAVLNSTSPGQVGWAAPELGGSVFGHFLWRGLRGEAYRSGKTGLLGWRGISLHDLHNYLKAQVGQWVKEKRVDDQEPMLLTSDDKVDFRVVYAQSPGESEVHSDLAHDSRWDEMDELWKKHRELEKQTPWRSDPLGWSQFQYKLLRSEQLLQAGEAYRSEYRDTKRESDLLADALAKGTTNRGMVAFSLPLAEQFQKWPSRQEAEKVRALWNLPAKNPPTKASSTDKKSQDKPKPQEETKPKVEPEYSLAATMAWNRMFSDESSNRTLPCNEVREILRSVDRAAGNRDADPIELHFLRMLCEYLDVDVWNKHSDQVLQALRARDLAERAAAPADERVHYGILPAVDKADQLRREAEDRLFVGNQNALAEAAGLWPRLVGKEAAYQKSIDRASEIAAAFAVRDRAYAETPWLVLWQLGRFHRSGVADMSPVDMIAKTRMLAKALDTWTESSQWPETARKLSEELQQELETHETALSKECVALRYAARDKRTLRSMQAVLESPLVSGEDRNALRHDYLREITKSAKEIIGGVDVDRPSVLSNADSDRSGIGRNDTSYVARLKSLMTAPKHPALLILGEAESDEDAAEMGARDTTAVDAKSTDTQALVDVQLDRLAKDGEEVRLRLHKTVFDQAKEQIQKTMVALGGKDASVRPAVVRSSCSQADRSVRAAAPLLTRSFWNQPAKDPTHQLQNLDRHYFLRWHAYRALDDFWGPKPGGDKSYFVIVGEACLKAAKTLVESSDSSTGSLWGPSLADAAELLKNRKKALEKGIRLEKPNDVPVDKKANCSEPLTLSMGSAAIVPSGEVRPESNLPEGEAAVYFEDLDRQPLPVETNTSSQTSATLNLLRRLGGLKVPPSGASPWIAKCCIPNDAKGERFQDGMTLQVVALYRGHRWPQEFHLIPEDGTVVEWKRPDYPNPTIKVSGDDKQTSAIMFILDCSGSMSYPTLTPDRNVTTRMEIARKTLEKILWDLAGNERQYFVGLQLYGHRVGWDDTNRGQLIWDPKNPTEKIIKNAQNASQLLNVDPGDDVETIQSPLPFGKTQCEDLCRKMREKSRPLGETPLYLAIVKAIDRLRAMNNISQRRVIVVTDGANNQTSGDLKWWQDVDNALRNSRDANQRTDLDIVGFTLGKADEVVMERRLEEILTLNPPNTGQVRKWLDWLRDPAEDTVRRSMENELQELKDKLRADQGTFHMVRDPTSLLKALEAFFRLSRYEVLGADNESRVTSEPLPLGATCDAIKKPLGRCEPYWVRLADPSRPAQAEVWLEGGEAIELEVQKEGPEEQRRLVHRRYQWELRDGCSRNRIRAPLDEEKRLFFVGAHVPKWEEDAVRFDVSVQNNDAEQFSPRPAEAWIEVRPAGSAKHDSATETPSGKTGRMNNTSKVYNFFDLYFEPHRPVPVLSCKALDWPKDVIDAEIRLWCKLKKTPPDHELTVGQFRKQKQWKPEGLSDLEYFEITGSNDAPENRCRVKITEKHKSVGDLYTVKVEMDPPPKSVTHVYNPVSGTVRHVFEYAPSEAGDVDGYHVRLTSRESLARDAIVLPEPLIVTLPRR